MLGTRQKMIHFTPRRENPRNSTPKKRAPVGTGATRARAMRSREFTYQKTYLLSAMGLAPKSRRLLAAVRAARTAGMPAAAAP